MPPTMVTMALAITSSSLSRSPSISTAASALISPSEGSRRTASRKYAVIASRLRRILAARPGLCWKLPSISANSSDQPLSMRWSEAGRPNISAVTIAGSGLARSAMTSISPVSPTASSRSAVILSIRPTRRSTLRGVNAAAARRRTRVCSGGSRNSICLTITLAIGARRSIPRVASFSGGGVRRAEKR